MPTSTRSEVRIVVPPLPRWAPDHISPQRRANSATRCPENGCRGTSCRHSTSGAMARTTPAAAATSSFRSRTLYDATRSESPMSAAALVLRADPGQVGRADQPCVVAQLGGDDAGLRPVAAAGELPREGGPRRLEEHVAGRADSTADDEGAGVEGRGQVGDADSEPVPDLAEQLPRGLVALARGLGDQGTGEVAGAALHPLEQVAGDRGVGVGQRPGLADQGVAAGVLLPAAPVAALATVPAGDDLHVAELPRDAEPAALDLPVDEEATADAGAQRHHHDVGLAARGAVLPLGPGGRVGVVVDVDRHRHALLQRLLQRLVTPRPVRGETQPGPGGGHEAGSADPHGGHLGGADQGQQLLDDVDDGVLHHRGALGAVRSVATRPVPDTAVRLHQPAGHLGAADVDADGQGSAHALNPRPPLPLPLPFGPIPSAASAAAPIIPASLPRLASANSASGRWPRPVSCRRNAARVGASSRAPASATPPPMTISSGSRSATTEAAPSPSQVPRSLSSSSAAGSPSLAARVTSWPRSADGSLPHSWARRAAMGVPDTTTSRASRTRALPLAYCSQHPRLPQPHRMPSGTTRR